MKGFDLLGRLVLGSWFILVGLIRWARFDPPLAPPRTALANELAQAFAASGITAVASIALVAAGLLVMAGRLTIVALMTGFSVFAAAAYWAILDGRIASLAIVSASLLLNAALLLLYRPYYAQLLRARSSDTVQRGEEDDTAIRRTMIASRYLWGGWWVISGLFHFFVGPLVGTSVLAVQVIMALLHSGLYEVVKAVETIGGLAVLSRRWAPLLLLLNVPITIVVVYWDAILQEPGNPIGIVVAIVTIIATLLMLRSYRHDLAPILTWRPVPIKRDQGMTAGDNGRSSRLQQEGQYA